MSSSVTLSDPIILKALLDESPHGLIIYQVIRNAARKPVDFRYQLLNSAAVRLLGYSQEELLGKSCQVVFPQADELRQYYQVVALTGQSVSVDYEHSPDGLWLEVLITGPTPDRLLCFFTDITDRRRAQQTLREENRRLKVAQAIGHVGSFEWNLGEERVFWSDELYQINGLEPQSEIITTAVANRFFHPDDRSSVNDLIVLSVQFPGRYALVHRIILRDGRVRWVNHQFESLANQAGQLVRVQGSVQDITRQRQTQQQLIQTGMNLQAVLEASPASIAFLTAIRGVDGQVTDMRLMVSNEKFAQLTQQSTSRLQGLSIIELEPFLWGHRTRKNLTQVLETGLPYYEEQLDLSRERYIGMSVTKQDDGVVLTGLDVTALKEAQNQLKQGLLDQQQSTENLQTLAELRNFQRQRGELLRAYSHDLRGSISIISGAASLLKLADTKIERLVMQDMIQRNAEQATRMLTELLDHSRLEAGQEQRTIIPLDGAQLLSELGHSMALLAAQKGLVFQAKGSASLPVEGDPLHIRRMAQNLLLNAIQYTQTGTITLEWGLETAGRWWFSVQDNGPGLSADVMMESSSAHPVLMNRGLTPVDTPPNGLPMEAMIGSSLPGEGIGLTIVRQLAELLGARLSLTSQPGVGTQFVVSLPERYRET